MPKSPSASLGIAAIVEPSVKVLSEMCLSSGNGDIYALMVRLPLAQSVVFQVNMAVVESALNMVRFRSEQ
jgi:hypothetical protein